MKLTSSPAADVLKQHDAGSVRKSILLITAVSLGTSALLAAVLWAYNPVHLRDASAYRVPDSGVYLSLGRNLIQHGQFSRSAAVRVGLGELLCANLVDLHPASLQ